MYQIFLYLHIYKTGEQKKKHVFKVSQKRGLFISRFSITQKYESDVKHIAYLILGITYYNFKTAALMYYFLENGYIIFIFAFYLYVFTI